MISAVGDGDERAHALQIPEQPMTFRPIIVTVVAIINIAYGLFFATGSLKAGVAPWLLNHLSETSFHPQRHVPTQAGDFAAPLPPKTQTGQTERKLSPRLTISFLARGIIEGTLLILLFISGIGLFRMKMWGRKLAIVSSIALIPMAILWAVAWNFVLEKELYVSIKQILEDIREHGAAITAKSFQDAYERPISDRKELIATMEESLKKNQQASNQTANQNQPGEVERTIQELKEGLAKMEKEAEAKRPRSRPMPALKPDAAEQSSPIVPCMLSIVLNCAWPLACLILLSKPTVRESMEWSDHLQKLGP